MNSDSTESEIRRYYEQASLSDARLEAMLDHGRTAAAVSRWKRFAGLSAVAAIFAFVACGYLWFRLNQSDQALKLADSQLERTLKQDQDPTPAGTQRDAAFQLVAVRQHGDRCPLCRAAGESFASLKNELSDAPIDFTLVNYRDAPDEAEATLEQFEMNSLLNDRRHKALIAVRSPSGVITELDVTDQSSPVREQVAKIIEAEK